MTVNQKGFTLLEVMIAFALLTTILFVAVVSQTSSLSSSSRSKSLLIATNLARNLLNEKEVEFEGVAFTEIPKEQTGEFPAPYEGFKFTLKVEEVDFGIMSEFLARQAVAAGEAQDANSETVIKLFEDYLKKSVRKLTLTVHYPDSGETSNLSFTELLVNYDAEFASGL